ncbi:PKD domain-containing protein [Bacteroidota bacterium]
MKTLTTIFCILILASISLFSQGGWYEQTSNTSEDLQSVQFLGSGYGWAAGGNEVLFTSDGGENWISKASGTLTQGLNDLHFINSATGWCTGTSGIIKTTDTGDSWILQEEGASEATKSIFFISSSTGWAVGTDGTILKTVNEGTDWSPQTSETTETLNAVYFTDTNYGYVVGDNATILKTTDSGMNWSSQSSGTYSGDFEDIYYINTMTGWVAGDNGAVFKTTDGGNAWEKLNTNNGDDFIFVFFLDDTLGWAGGKFGTIIKTKDGGTTWKMLGSTIVTPLNDLYFDTFRLGWSVGNQGKIIQSLSGGEEIRSKFSADTTTGIAPFAVNFINESTGYPSSYLWAFGDGVTSTEENPSHTYITSGEYTVTLSITSGTYTDNRFREGYIVVDDVLAAEFDASPTASSATMTVNFNDRTSSPPDTWDWDFGDGNSSTFQNPSHSYENPGQYTVELTVTNYQGSDSETKTDYITVYEPINAEFNGAPKSGPAPLEVHFTDNSAGHPNSRNWNFGDGQTSTEQNPVHTYQNSGTYTVTLSVSDGIHTDMESIYSYIKVTDALNADFSASPTEGELPLTVSFTDQSHGGANYWSWDFGDGKSSTQQNPVHTYILPGSYDVELTISDGTDTDSKLETDYIIVTGTPVLNADFSAAPLTGTEPLTVSFTDLTEGGVAEWNWDFGDGQTSTEQNPSSIYKTEGTYSVTLIISNGLTQDTAIKEDLITVFPRQSDELDAEFEADITSGNKPLVVRFTDLSTGDPVSHSWNFGDGNTTTTQNPINNYSESGTFTVSLTVTNEDDSTDTETKENYIWVLTDISVNDYGNSLLFTDAYPNPFTDFTNIKYNLARNADVTIKVFDILGNEITTLINSEQNEGSYNVIWNPQNPDGSALPLGIYYYEITTKSGNEMETITGKMVMIK